MSDTLRINNLFTTAIGYSTLTGSTITTNSLSLSTLTVSSINSGAPGVAAYSTLNVSTLNATSTITGSTINALTGRMGIGTSAAAQKLDIVDSASVAMGVRLQSQYSAGYLSMGSVVGVNSYIGLQSGVATTSALTTPTLCVTNANNVGIGTANPGYLLTVGANVNPTANSAGTTVLQCNGNLNIFRTRLIFSSAPADWNHCIYNNSFNLDNEGAWDGMKFNVYNGAWFRVGTAAGSVPTTAMYINATGQVGIGTVNPAHVLDVSGSSNVVARFQNPGEYVRISLDGLSGGDIIYKVAGVSKWGIACINNHLQFLLNDSTSTIPVTFTSGGQVGIGTTTPFANTVLDIRGAVTINNGTNVANATGRMAAGSLTIGSTTTNYGGQFSGSWEMTNTACLFMECLDNTEIAVHDSGHRLTSLLYYAGGGSSNNITIGRNMGYGVPSVSITGALSKASGTFDIEHPLYPNTSKRLVHSFVEGPRCDLIYRGKTTLVNGTAVVDINKECTHSPECAMDDGTFEALCANPQIFLQNNKSFDRIIGSISGCILTITSENSVSNVVIEWMVIAERADSFIKQWDRTNPDGYLITQYTK